MLHVAPEWGAGLVGGLAGAIAMTIFWTVMRMAGWMRLDWGLLLGTLFVPEGRLAMGLGWGLHVMIGVLSGAIYLALVGPLGRLIGWERGDGLLLGGVHALLGLAVLTALPRFHPRLRVRAWPGRERGLFALGFWLFGGVWEWGASTVLSRPESLGALLSGLIVFGLVLILALSLREPSEWRFASAMPSPEERKEALRRRFESGLMSRSEYEAACREFDH